MPQQLPLFGAEPDPPPSVRGDPLTTAELEPALVALAESLPAWIHLGTSSWTFPGWAGLVYGQKATQARLAKEGLAAYAGHPLFRLVGVDRTYYAPVETGVYQQWAASVPDSFRFLVKAHDWITVPEFGDHPRFGERRNQANDRFLDPDYALESMIGPLEEGLGEKTAALIFQFSPLRLNRLGGAGKLLERLHAFLSALPGELLLAVELRNHDLLLPDYAALLKDVSACHCFTIHSSMPGIPEQAEIVGPQPATVVRWMLGHGQFYQDALARYEPFDRLVDEDPESRSDIAALLSNEAKRRVPAYVTVNNKAEGSSPESVKKLAQEILQRTGAKPELS